MSDKKDEIKSSNDFKITNTVNIDNSKPLQSVANVVVPPKEKEIEQIITQVANKTQEQELLNSDELKNKILGGINLPTKHLLTLNFEKKLEKRLFNPSLPNCAFKKYIQIREIDGHDHVSGMSTLTPLYMRTVDDLAVGVKMFNSNTKSIVTRMFFKPGVTNLVLVKSKLMESQIIDMSHDMNILRKDLPHYPIGDGDLKIYTAEWTLFSNMQDPQIGFNPTNYDDIHGGPTCRNNMGFIYRIGLDNLWESELSYETEFSNMYNKLNYDPQIPNQLLDPMRRANLRTANMQMRDVVFYLYNEAPKDKLIYSPILEQLKVALYTDMFLTGFDMVEGLSQMSKRGFDKLVYDSSGQYFTSENLSNMHESGQPIRIIGCSWQQYLEYTNGRVPFFDQNYDFRMPWMCIPIKRDWLRDPNAFFAYLISVLPYPISCYYVPLVWARDATVDVNDNNLRYDLYNGFAEHCSSRVRIQGYNNILLVLLDSVNTDEMNPANPGYDDLWSINMFGQQYRFLNLFNAPNVIVGMDFHNRFFASLTAVAQALDDEPTLLIDGWVRCMKWNFYADIFNLVAYFTTRNGIHYRGHETYSSRFNTECLCSLVPAIDFARNGDHMVIGSPSFIQRIYAILGMVRQKGSDFIGAMGKIDFREFMFAKRYSFAMLKSYLIDDKRNQVRVVFPAYGGAHLDGELENRRIQFGLLYHKYIEYLPEVSVKWGTFTSTGLLTYIRPAAQVGTYMTSWNDAWTDVNEYGGLNDWANLMETSLQSSEYRIPLLDEDNLKNFSVEGGEDYVTFFPGKYDSTVYDQLLKSWNNTFGRTLISFTPVLVQRVIEVWYGTNEDRFNAVPWEYYQPIWTIGINTWNADRDINIPRAPMLLYSDIAFTIDTFWGTFLPQVRVLDYNIPFVKMWNKKYIIYRMSQFLINSPQPYINIIPRDGPIVYMNDRINRQGYEKLNE